jgi:hypothetical protein
LFGFLLALCSGGSGGGGNYNFSPPSNTGEFGYPPGSIPSPEQFFSQEWISILITLLVAFCCLILILTVLGIVVRAVTRTALIGMVRQITETETVTIRDGWRHGWSRGAWRVFLVGLVIGIPVAIVGFVLVLLALTPLLLLFTGETGPMVTSVFLTIMAIFVVMVVMLIIAVVVVPVQELAWRRTVLDKIGVIASVTEIFGIIKRNFKDVLVIWLLMIAIGIGWFFVFLFIMLVGVIAALLLGGIPGGLVYLISGSVWGAVIAGGVPAFIVLVLVITFSSGLYLTFRSAVWTLAYLGIDTTLPQPGITPEPALEPEPGPVVGLQPEPEPELETEPEPERERQPEPEPESKPESETEPDPKPSSPDLTGTSPLKPEPGV